MDSSDRLIEYYFQRKIGGMPLNDIESSLHQQMLEEEIRDLIISQVLSKEAIYLKALRSKRLAAIFRVISIALLVLGLATLISSFAYHQISFLTLIVLSLVTAAAIFGVVSVLFYQRAKKPSFQL